MPSLSDADIQTIYARKCAEIWTNGSTYDFNARWGKIINAINEVLYSCKIPLVTIYEGNPCLIEKDWYLLFHGDYLKDGITVDFFARGVTTLYHEARHAEQFYLMLQGIALGKFRLPQPPGKLVIPSRADKFSMSKAMAKPKETITAKIISKKCLVPLPVAEAAYKNRRSYPENKHRIITQWYRSIYGFKRKDRGKVLKHLEWDPYYNNQADDNFAAYLQLAEEKDAFLIQDEVLARLSNELQMWK